jgi:acyl-CoA thioester hydrolase
MIRPYELVIPPDWVDYNNHLNEGYYGVVLSDTGDHVLTELGFGAVYRREVRGTFFTAENHTRFLREVEGGSAIRVETTVLGVDAKRLHLWHVMRDATEGWEAATQESMLLHVDIESGRVSPMGDEIRRAAEALVTPDIPVGVGRVIRRVDG